MWKETVAAKLFLRLIICAAHSLQQKWTAQTPAWYAAPTQCYNNSFLGCSGMKRPLRLRAVRKRHSTPLGVRNLL